MELQLNTPQVCETWQKLRIPTFLNFTPNTCWKWADTSKAQEQEVQTLQNVLITLPNLFQIVCFFNTLHYSTISSLQREFWSVASDWVNACHCQLSMTSDSSQFSMTTFKHKACKIFLSSPQSGRNHSRFTHTERFCVRSHSSVWRKGVSSEICHHKF